jgi:predicted RNase H-related nuclease YkuK (DUF458 family)
MDRWFRTEQNLLVDIVDHTIQQVKEHDNIEIYIGTDSQNHGHVTKYSTAIVYRFGNNGCHYIHKEVKVPRIRDQFSRLFKEAEYTVEVAEIITKQTPIRIAFLEFDYNNKKKTQSTNVISAAVGWATSLGYKTKVKPDDMIATKAADKHSRL